MPRPVNAVARRNQVEAMIHRLERRAKVADALAAGVSLATTAKSVGVSVRTARSDAQAARARHLQLVPGGPAAWFRAQANELRALKDGGPLPEAWFSDDESRR